MESPPDSHAPLPLDLPGRDLPAAADQLAPTEAPILAALEASLPQVPEAVQVGLCDVLEAPPPLPSLAPGPLPPLPAQAADAAPLPAWPPQPPIELVAEAAAEAPGAALAQIDREFLEFLDRAHTDDSCTCTIRTLKSNCFFS